MKGAEAIVSSKGQVVIPAHLRRRLGIATGTHLVFHEEGDRLVLVKAAVDDVVARAIGSALAPGQGVGDTDSFLRELRGEAS